MEKLKYIKIEHEDGTLSENVPIGADAINVDYNDTTVKDELDRLHATDDSLANIQNNQETKLVNLQTQVNGLASGSPLVASSTSEMTDISRVYVNTTDGHWYYYANNQWNDGGVYQSQLIGDNEIIYNNFDTKLQDLLKCNFKIINNDATFTNNYFVEKNGEIVPASNAGLANDIISCCEINVNSGEIYKITGMDFGRAPLYLLKDENGNVISYSNISSWSSTYVYIDKNIKKLLINNPYGRNLLPIIEKMNSFSLSNNVENEIIKPVNNTVHFTNPIIQTSSQYSRWCIFDWSTDDLPISLGDDLLFSFNIYLKDASKYSGAQLFFKTDVLHWQLFAQPQPFVGNGNYIYHFRANDLILNTTKLLIAPLFSESNATFDGYISDIKIYNVTQKEIYENVELTLNEDDYAKLEDFSKITYLLKEQFLSIMPEPEPNNILELLKCDNKNLVFFGDSIVNGQGATPYSSRLKTLLNLNLSTKKGFSGGTLSEHNGRTFITSEILDFDFTNYDYCLIQVGTNDLTEGTELGTLETYATTYDNTKFYDCYRKSLDYILNNNPNIRIILLTPLQRKGYGGYNPLTKNSVNLCLVDYVQAVKNIGGFYSIPVVDMFSNCGLNLQNINLFTSDGLHPNNDGYEKITKYLAKQITIV